MNLKQILNSKQQLLEVINKTSIWNVNKGRKGSSSQHIIVQEEGNTTFIVFVKV